MESGSGSRREQPPKLPVKQHRPSSVDSDCVFLSHGGFQHQSAGHNDVFPEPTDCHAAQCPIHQRYDPCRHQERFFSAGTPPPVPRKKLTRTLSLPGIRTPPLPPLSPLSPRRRRPLNFDNLVYMMAPIPDTYIHEETEDLQSSEGSAASAPSFSQLAFDAPDEHLCSLFRNFVDQRLVSELVQHRHLLFLRSMAQRVEDRSLLRAPRRDFSSLQPEDFLLREGSKPRLIGDETFYSLHSPKFPERELGLRVLKRTHEAASHGRPPNVNVREVVARFQPSVVLKNDTDTVRDRPSRDSCSTESGCSTEVPPDSPSLRSFLHRGHCVRVERDLPRATLEDFVRESSSLQSSESQRYDRQVCVLLLQILTGSHHLYNNSAAAAELRPQEILLVWRGRQADASEGQGSEQEEETETRETVQVLWKRHGSPCVVLEPQSPALATPQPLTAIKSQIGSLIHFCLRPSAAPTAQASDLLTSPYRSGLLHLSSQLRSDNGPQMTEMMTTLQVLLWGPRASLFGRAGLTPGAVQNWLTVKRALLVMKLGERGLIQDQSAPDWEDGMCLKYLSFADSEAVVGVAAQLWNALNTDSGL